MKESQETSACKGKISFSPSEHGKLCCGHFECFHVFFRTVLVTCSVDQGYYFKPPIDTRAEYGGMMHHGTCPNTKMGSSAK